MFIHNSGICCTIIKIIKCDVYIFFSGWNMTDMFCAVNFFWFFKPYLFEVRKKIFILQYKTSIQNNCTDQLANRNNINLIYPLTICNSTHSRPDDITSSPRLESRLSSWGCGHGAYGEHTSWEICDSVSLWLWHGSRKRAVRCLWPFHLWQKNL